MNMFTPKSKQGQWSTIIETNRQGSDDQSDRSILHQVNTNVAGGPGNSTEEGQARTGERQSYKGQQIKKTTQVDVSYDKE